MVRKESLMFALGFFSSLLLVYSFFYIGVEVPFGSGLSVGNGGEVPKDRLRYSDILVFEDRIVLKISNASISSYAPTGSMKPLLDFGSNGIRIIPNSENDLDVGDIISFEKDDKLIVHRIVEVSEDSEGKYFITKGDNNSVSDGKIRFNDIRYVTIGILW